MRQGLRPHQKNEKPLPSSLAAPRALARHLCLPSEFQPLYSPPLGANPAPSHSAVWTKTSTAVPLWPILVLLSWPPLSPFLMTPRLRVLCPQARATPRRATASSLSDRCHRAACAYIAQECEVYRAPVRSSTAIR